MCWGNFCYIPGPALWDENARSLMLGWLPTVGFFIGLIWTLLYQLMVYFSLPFFLVTFLMTFLPFLLSGFIHVDGFMDVSDATLSRASIEKKHMILKDSHVGAFAVIAFVFIVLGFYSVMGCAVNRGIELTYPVLICVLSRCIAGLEVLLSRPMGTSQYNLMAASGQGVILLVIQMVIYTGVCVLFSPSILGAALVIGGTVLGTFIPCVIAKHSLQGMNGDIAGYSIIWGEFFGALMLIVC